MGAPVTTVRHDDAAKLGTHWYIGVRQARRRLGASASLLEGPEAIVKALCADASRKCLQVKPHRGGTFSAVEGRVMTTRPGSRSLTPRSVRAGYIPPL
jgi:hypothetical protein